MCRRCGSDKILFFDTVVYSDDDTIVSILCPNCMAEIVKARKFPRTAGRYTSELSGVFGALKVVYGAGSDDPDTYFLLGSEAERLFRRELTPEEFFILDRDYHGRYLIHDDFYHPETGRALQPMSGNL